MTTIAGRPIGETKSAGAAVLAPTTAATIVTLGILPAGTYKVNTLSLNTGTAETSTAGLVNIGLYHGSTLVTGLPTVGFPVPQVFERITVNGTESIALKAIGAAIAGSMYVGNLSAVKLGG
jgi:hypothetical protein